MPLSILVRLVASLSSVGGHASSSVEDVRLAPAGSYPVGYPVSLLQLLVGEGKLGAAAVHWLGRAHRVPLAMHLHLVWLIGLLLLVCLQRREGKTVSLLRVKTVNLLGRVRQEDLVSVSTV